MTTVQNKYFPYIVGLSAFLVAASAAFFSIYGLSKLFSGASLQVIIMAGSLEFSKIISASFLYRFWKKINLIMKFYLTIGIIILVLITSAGIFGYLSSAYQGTTLEFEKQATQSLALEDELNRLTEDKNFLLSEMQEQLDSYPENYRTAKRKVRDSYMLQISEINKQIQNISPRLSELKLQMVQSGVDVGPAIYIARTFDTSVDTVVTFFIFILIFVFDPMAIALVIATNITMTNIITPDNNIVSNKIVSSGNDKTGPAMKIKSVLSDKGNTIQSIKKNISDDSIRKDVRVPKTKDSISP